MRNRLKTTVLISGLAVALGGASVASAAVPIMAANDYAAPARLDNAVSYAGEAGQFEKTQFFWGGRNYCWYPGGWRGPGYYWCGFQWRRGYGWGGPVGWHGWGRRDGGWRDGGDRGGWRGGDHRDWHGGGGDRGGDRGGGDHGDHHH